MESDHPEYDMDEIDQKWFIQTGKQVCPKLTHLEVEWIIDKLEDASTRTLVSLDEARALFSENSSMITDDLHITTVYKHWHQRRTKSVKKYSVNSIDECIQMLMLKDLGFLFLFNRNLSESTFESTFTN